MHLLIAFWRDAGSAIWFTKFPLCEVDQTHKASRASAGRPRALAAFVLRLVDPVSNEISRAGYAGILLDPCHSAFHAELVAMEAAVSFVFGIIKDPVGASQGRRRKRKIQFQDIENFN